MSLDSLSLQRFVESSITISNSGGYVIGFRLSVFLSGDESRSASVLREREKREREVSIIIRSH